MALDRAPSNITSLKQGKSYGNVPQNYAVSKYTIYFG